MIYKPVYDYTIEPGTPSQCLWFVYIWNLETGEMLSHIQTNHCWWYGAESYSLEDVKRRAQQDCARLERIRFMKWACQPAVLSYYGKDIAMLRSHP